MECSSVSTRISFCLFAYFFVFICFLCMCLMWSIHSCSEVGTCIYRHDYRVRRAEIYPTAQLSSMLIAAHHRNTTQQSYPAVTCRVAEPQSNRALHAEKRAKIIQFASLSVLQRPLSFSRSGIVSRDSPQSKSPSNYLVSPASTLTKLRPTSLSICLQSSIYNTPPTQFNEFSNS